MQAICVIQQEDRDNWVIVHMYTHYMRQKVSPTFPQTDSCPKSIATRLVYSYYHLVNMYGGLLRR